MERSFFAAIVAGLLGIATTVGVLGFVWAGPKLPHPIPPRTRRCVRWVWKRACRESYRGLRVG